MKILVGALDFLETTADQLLYKLAGKWMATATSNGRLL